MPKRRRERGEGGWAGPPQGEVAATARPSRRAAENGDSGSALPPGWREAVDGSGKAYFYNEQTKVTTWERPVAPEPGEAGGGSPAARSKKAAWLGKAAEDGLL